MHLLRAGEAQLPPTYDLAYREAERLVMEIDVDDLDPAAAAQFTARHATYPPGAGLRAALGERRWQRARTEFDRVGVPLDARPPRALGRVARLFGGGHDAARLRPATRRRGTAEVARRGRPQGHHRPRDPRVPAGPVRCALGRRPGATAGADDRRRRGSAREIDRLTAAWRGGDGAALATLLLREYRRFPTLYEALVYRRNRDWVPQVEALLERGDDSLVVVGAMHLVGRQGLIELLRARGHDPRPLRLN